MPSVGITSRKERKSCVRRREKEKRGKDWRKEGEEGGRRERRGRRGRRKESRGRREEEGREKGGTRAHLFQAIAEAIQAWDLVLKPRGWPMYDDWIEFTKDNVKAVNPDTWNMLWKFMCEFPEDMKTYNEAG
jgi:hypothetical protein